MAERLCSPHPSMVTPTKEFCDMVERDMNLDSVPDTADSSSLNFSKFVRRSARNPEITHVTRPDVWKLRNKIKNNDDCTVVFKLKDHSISDLTSVVLDMLIQDLGENTVCQALYVQNISEAMGEAQLAALTDVLRKKMIWCLNIGENYQISLEGWTRFCKALPETNVTHLYVSEHTIPLSLKNEMRDQIRENRKKHTLHKSEDNIEVIERCTNMWWNPINHLKRKEQERLQAAEREEEDRVERKRKLQEEKVAAVEAAKAKQPAKKRKQSAAVDPAFEGEAWTFSCICGEKCSHYENPRYHPRGAQFECDECHVWSHVKCVLKKLPRDSNAPLYCRPCKTALLRKQRHESQWLPVDAVVLASRQSDAAVVVCNTGSGKEELKPDIAATEEGRDNSDVKMAPMPSPCLLNMSCADEVPLEPMGAERVSVERVISMSNQC